MLAGCGKFGRSIGIDIFNWQVPKLPVHLAQTVSDARDVATIYAIALGKIDDLIANEVQFFELPMIGAAATAVGSLAFGAHPDVALGAGLTGTALGATNEYYAPRQRRLILLNARDAMICVAGIATTLEPSQPRNDLQEFVNASGEISTEYEKEVDAGGVKQRQRVKFAPGQPGSDEKIKAAIKDLESARATFADQSSEAAKQAIAPSRVNRALATDALIAAVAAETQKKQDLLDVSKKAGEAAKAADQAITQTKSALPLLVDAMMTIDNKLRLNMIASSKAQDFSALENKFREAQKHAYDLARETDKVKAEYSNRVQQAGVQAQTGNAGTVQQAQDKAKAATAQLTENPTVTTAIELPDRLAACVAKAG
jgi:hypothetical protein